MKKLRNLNKVFSILTAWFFLSAQPLYANPFVPQEFEDDDQQTGFVDAERAEEGRQRQLNEVSRMENTLQDGFPDDEPNSVLTKFQKTDQQTEDQLAENAASESALSDEFAAEKADSENDVALLGLNPVAAPDVPATVPLEEASEEESNDTVELVEGESEEEGLKPVAKAETKEEETEPGLKQIQIEETVETNLTPVELADTADSGSSSEGQEKVSTGDPLENLDENPILLAGLSVVAVPDPLPEEPLELGDSVESTLPVTGKSESAVATELAALMGISSNGTAISSSSPSMSIEGSSMMGALPQSVSAPQEPAEQEAAAQDPPIVLLPIPQPTIPFIPGTLGPEGTDTAADDYVGGLSLFGDLLEAIRGIIFADNNLAPDGTVIGDGVNDKVTLLSSFMVMFFQFFGLNFDVETLSNLILRGTTEDGVDLFGIGGDEPIVPVMMLFSSFVLATSLFFPQSSATGLDIDGIRGTNPNAFKIMLPIIIPESLLLSLGQFSDPNKESMDPDEKLTDEEALALGRLLMSAGIRNALGITLSVATPNDGKPVKIFNPEDLDNLGEIASDKTLDLTLPEDAIQFLFSSDLAPGEATGNETLMALLQAMNEDGVISQTGLFGIMTIDLSSIANLIGDYITEVFTDDLGAALDYYRSIGFETGVNGPPPALPLLLKIGFGFRPGAGGDPSVFSNPLFFPLTLALPLIFTLSRPPIPDISNPDDENAFNKNINDVFYSNAQESFEDQEEAREAAAEEGKKKKVSKPKDKKAPSKAAQQAAKAAKK